MFFIFSVSLFCISLLQPLSLQEPLSLDEAQQYSAKKVRVTGFLYSLPTGEQLIGNQPNLRSCCIGSKKMAYQQLLLTEAIPSSLAAVTVIGEFHLNLGKEKERFPYLLTQISLEKKTVIAPFYYLLLTLAFVILLSFCFLRFYKRG